MQEETKKVPVGFIGLGVMGKSMAGHLLAAGYPLHVSTRTKSRADELLARGAIWQNSPGEVAAASAVIISMVGYPRDVEEIYFGDQGILHHSRRGSTVVDMTTSSPLLAEKVYARAAELGVAALDAPVSGGDIGAREARLSIMVGGDQAALDAVKPILAHLGTNIVYQGKAGSGQHCKMANQIAIASNLIGVCEAIRYAEKAGLSAETVLESIASGAAGSWSLSNLGPRMLKKDFAPGFYVKHFIKDMGIALESCERIGLQAEGLKLAKSLFDRLAAQGGEDDGTQALYTLYR